MAQSKTKPSLKQKQDLSLKSIGIVLLSEFRKYQGDGTFCDVILLPSGRGPPVKVHSVVLAAVSHYVKDLLKLEAEDDYCVMLPDVDYRELNVAVEDVYSGRSSQGLLQCLGAENFIKKEPLEKDVHSEENVNYDVEVPVKFEVCPDVSDVLNETESGGDLIDNDTGIYNGSVCEDIDYDGRIDFTEKNNKVSNRKHTGTKKRKAKRETNLLDTDTKPVKKRKYTPRPYVVNQIANLICDCEVKKTFSSEKARNKHLRDVHSDYPKFKCTIPNCNYIFGMQKTLERHLDKFHGHQCSDCSRAYKDEKTLQSHKCPNSLSSKHVGGFFCDQCGKKLANSDSLKEHMFIHDDLKWPCDECPKIFNRELNLKFHKKSIHSTQTFICQLCAHQCKNLRSLRLHNQTTHKSDEEKRFRCEICGKGWINKQKLQIHMVNVHIKNTPYSCRYECGKAYNDRSNRRAHEIKFHGSLHHSAIKEMLSSNNYSLRTMKVCNMQNIDPLQLKDDTNIRKNSLLKTNANFRTSMSDD